MANGSSLMRVLCVALGCALVSLVGCSSTLENFPNIYTLTVNSVSPAAGVMIGVSPADISGNGPGSSSFTRLYNSGTSVTLTAPATTGAFAFTSWNGCATTAGATCTVAMNGNNTVTASYSTPPPITQTLTVNSSNPAAIGIGVSPVDNNNAGIGTTSFKRVYNKGAAVVLTAPATAAGNTFTSWTGCTTTTATVCNVTLAADTTVTANFTTPVITTYTLTVNSTNPSGAVGIGVSQLDNNGAGAGNSSFARVYNAGTSVTLTAPSIASTDLFASWTGCTSTTGVTCVVALTANTTVVANFTPNAVTNVAITPSPASATIGSTQQFTAALTGTGVFSQAVTWSVTGPMGYTGNVGTITSSGLYTTPYPAPPAVTVTATSTTTPAQAGSVAVTLAAPATAAGPALSVSPASPTGTISPLIYGVNDYALDSASIKTANPSIIRWGGDNTTRYNYVANTSNAASDYYFENLPGSSNQWPTGNFADLVTGASAAKAQVIGTAPLIGWVATANVSSTACSFQKSFDPNQQSYNGVCGNGIDIGGNNVVGSNAIAQITSMAEPPPQPPTPGTPVASSWVGNWVNSIVAQFGPGNPTTGTPHSVAHWDLDNEPEYWSGVHRDVHPVPMTYDELTKAGVGTALAIKTADPTAQVSGPVISGWYNYFYSGKDVNQGYGAGPCYKPWGSPTDRQAHAGIPLIEYYLQQMKAAELAYGKRLLDYVDIHAYFAANYNGATTGLTTAGDTAQQTARLNSTRVFWDPTYTDPNYTQPNYLTDTGYTTSCTPPNLAPQLIPTLKTWVSHDYPGTKTSIDEYNFGGNESINGAVTQADILGIFGKYGLDMGLLWPTTNYNTQGPGNMAFAMYRNYDGNNSGFGDTALTSSSANQGLLSVYGAKRTADGSITVMVVNKGYGALTSTLSLPGFTPTAPAQVYLYSNASLTSIVAGSPLAVTPPAIGSTTSTLTATYPAQSITLLILR